MTEAEQDIAEKSNKQEAKALGLKSGDFESVKKALEKIVNNTDYPLLLQAAAKTLLDSRCLMFVKDRVRSEVTWANTKFEMASYDREAGFVGRYNPENDTVSLNLRGSNGKSLGSVLIREYIHATIHKAISDPSSANSPDVSLLMKVVE